MVLPSFIIQAFDPSSSRRKSLDTHDLLPRVAYPGLF
jgi:hypothetical protein